MKDASGSELEQVEYERIDPVGYRVLVKKDEKEEVSSGGIVIPDAVVDKEYAAESRGTVIAIGTAAFDDDPDAKDMVKKGSRIMYRKYSGVAVDKDDESLVIINDKDIVAVTVGGCNDIRRK